VELQYLLHSSDAMLPPEQTIHFGAFDFSRLKGLWKGTEPIPLPNLERQLLKCLLDRKDEIVRREELLAAVWPDTHVSANALDALVHRLRRRLGDSDRPHKLLRVYRRIGFMLVASKRRRRPVDIAPTTRRGDQSRFIRDITIPDGAILAPGEPFEKVWEIQNIGTVPWKNRRLRRIGICSGLGRLTSEPSFPLPHTAPGEMCLVRIDLVAPVQPGSYYAAWKMVDSAGRECLPKHTPVFVSIDIIAETSG